MLQLECDNDGCKGKPIFIEYECDGATIFCRNHGNMQIMKDLNYRVKHLTSKIKTTRRHLQCQNSEEGHVFPPPPSSNLYLDGVDDNTYMSVSTSATLDFMGGTPHKCTKCGYTYYDPSGLLNISDISFHVGGTLKEIDLPELKFNIPSEPANRPILKTPDEPSGLVLNNDGKLLLEFAKNPLGGIKP